MIPAVHTFMIYYQFIMESLFHAPHKKWHKCDQIYKISPIPVHSGGRPFHRFPSQISDAPFNM